MMKRFLLLALLCGLPSWGAIAFVQSKSAEAGTVASATLTFTSSNTPGSLLIAVARIGNFNESPVISDPTNGTWPTADVFINDSVNSRSNYIFSFPNNAASSALTVTITINNAQTIRWAIYEFTGLAATTPLDKTASAQDTSTTPDSGATATTSQANELFFGHVGVESNVTFTAGTNVAWILKETPPSNGNGRVAGEYFIANATQAADARMTLSGSVLWYSLAATYKAAAGGPPPNQFPRIAHRVTQSY